MDKRLKAISKVSIALALCGASATATIAIPKADNAMAATKKTTKKTTSKKTTKKTTSKKTAKKAAAKKSKAKNRKKISGTLTVATKNGKQVRLYDDKGGATKTYKKNGSKFVVYEQATINGQLMYRIGSSKQWIPAKYAKVTLKKTKKKIAKKKTVKKTTPKKATTTKKVTKKPVKKATPASAYVTVYNSKGKPVKIYKEIRAFGPTVETHIKKGSKVVVLGQGPINGQLMYNILTMKSNGDYTKEYWVPAKDVKVDYFTGVGYVDYDTYHFGPADANTPAKAKADFDAELAEAEKNNPDAGFTMWFSAHPLENMRMWSKKTKVSKSTYEKHNLTYAQEAASFGRNSVGYTKEAYTAYIKGEAAYRQYEAKWAAKYPNITKYMNELFKNDSNYKKYNLNTFEWHYNDNYYINIRK